jgi:hypothetical protein
MSKLTTAQRQKLCKTKSICRKNYAFPKKAPGPGSYPIHDVAHQRAALAMGKRYLSAKNYAILKKKIAAKKIAAKKLIRR